MRPPTHLRRVVLRDPEPDRLAGFLVDAFGLRLAARQGATSYLRGAGPEHHLVAIEPGPRGVRLYSLALESAAAVDDAAGELAVAPGVRLVSRPAALDEPGGGYGFRLADVDGRMIELSAGVAVADPLRHAGPRPPAVPIRISHLVLNSPRAERHAELLTGHLGFRLADEMPHMLFFGCGTDHHSIAVARAPHASLNHIAFEVDSVAEVLAGIAHLESAGCPTLWGPGRHGPGHNAFGYFSAPGGQVVEYTAEVEQVLDRAAARPRMWLPEEIEVADAWADPSSARPTAAARAAMLGEPEPPEVAPSLPEGG